MLVVKLVLVIVSVLVVLVLVVSPFLSTVAPVLIFLGFGEEGSAVWLVPSESPLDSESYSVIDADADTHANLDLSALDSFSTL